MKIDKLKVLFICKDSAVRSQMAAAFLNAYFGDRYEAYYAGIEPSEINSNAAKAMKEIGIDISSGRPKKIEDLRGEKFDCIITLCDYAKAHLPALPEHKKQLHQSFKNFCLPMLCENAKNFEMCFPEQKKVHQKGRYDTKEIEKDTLSAFRYLREAIFNWVENEAIF